MLALPGSAYLYQGEELGLPEHTTLPDEVPAGPGLGALRAHRARPGRLPGADPVGGGRPVVRLRARPTRAGCRSRAVWAEYALDRQRGVPGSTYELYRTALRLRREHAARRAARCRWVDAPAEVLAFRNGDAAGADQLRRPSRPTLAGSSGPGRCSSQRAAGRDGRVPRDVTVWARV